MKKRILVYAAILLLFIFAMAALVSHFSNIRSVEGRASRQATLPFGYMNGQVVTLTPEAESAGIRLGDRIGAINGRDLGIGEVVIDEEMSKMRSGTEVVLSMQRRRADGGTDTYDTAIAPVKVERDLQFYSRYVVGFIFAYLLPTLCILLGFYVLFARPYDPLAWILLLVLLGLSSLPLESYPSNTAVGAYQDIFFGSWALGMLLFGIYFPERLSLDVKLPWLKWILIVPLSFQIVVTLLSLVRVFLGIDFLIYIRPLAAAYSKVGFFVNMLAIGLFFSTLGYKSGTMTNPDARRRMKLLVYGTSAAMLPVRAKSCTECCHSGSP
jgi:sigma-B regulation protein RsbU (phosphoserine phosphatase)